MEPICYSVGGIGGFDDSRSVSSLTTVPVSNRSKVTPEVSRMAEVPHNEDEKDIDTIGSDPSHEVAGSHHPSIFSDLTTSDNSEALDPDLQAVVEQAKKEAKRQQRKRNRERAKQAEHEDQQKRTKKRRDDDEDEGDGKPPAAAAPAAPPAVSAK